MSCPLIPKASRYSEVALCCLYRRFPTVERRAVLHQEGNVLTQIPSDEELCDSVLKELGSRKNPAAGLEEVCDVSGISVKETSELTGR